jgi:hypothetical protein
MKTLLFVSILTTLVAACYRSPIGMPLPLASRFEGEWRNYSRLQPNKALAIAGDTQGTYVIGYAHALASEPDAVAQAMLACEARRADRRIEAPCRTYAVGERPVETASTTEPSFVR